MRSGFAAALIVASNIIATWGEASESVSSFRLENGLEIVVIENRSQSDVAHTVWYRVGAADEPPGKSGVANLVGQLMVGGAEKNSSEQIAGIGGTKVFCYYDYTSFLQLGANAHLERMMQFEANRMKGVVVNRQEFEAIRSEIHFEQKKERETNPHMLFGEQRLAALFMNHPYGIPVKGWPHEIEKLSAEDAIDFFRRHFAPNNAILVVAGDVAAGEVLNLAGKHFGSIERVPGIRPRSRPAEPPHRVETRLIYKDERAKMPYLVRHYLAPKRDAGDQSSAAALMVAEELLGGEKIESIFARELEMERMLALHTSASYVGTSFDEFAFGVFVMPARGVSLLAAEAALDEVLGDFLENGPDPNDLKRVQAQLQASRQSESSQAMMQAMKYGQALTVGLTVEDIQEWPEIVGELTGEYIVDVAKRVFDKKRSVTGWMMAADSD